MCQWPPDRQLLGFQLILQAAEVNLCIFRPWRKLSVRRHSNSWMVFFWRIRMKNGYPYL